MSGSAESLFTAIGLMSGTLDGRIDVALIESDGRDIVRPLGFLTVPYEPADRATIRACFGRKDRRDPQVLEVESCSPCVMPKR